METRATDSTAEMIDQTIESMMEKGKSRSGHDHCRGEKAMLMLPQGNEDAETTPSWLLGLQFGVKYEVNSLGHRINDVGSEKLTRIHLKADLDDRCHPDSVIYLVRFSLPDIFIWRKGIEYFWYIFFVTTHKGILASGKVGTYIYRKYSDKYFVFGLNE
ncbi:hypothetical protein HAX54_044866 [Datura stramonium]|uniref:Uncharacterized protein n=1 Tax=Datura stramonium TaxID=4076 RepID=A0ABS8RPS3_DATST|nr:hypothetical protein [Datura stramonium]